MGIDITMYAEKRVSGKWEKIGFVFKDHREDDYTDEPYEGRNYDLFAVLANVTNYNKINPISKLKGIPKDVSADVKELFYDSWDYMYSYLTLKELKDYDWEQQIIPVGVITEEQYVKMKNTKQYPDGWMGDISGSGCITVTPDEMDKILSGKKNRDNSLEYYVRTELEPIAYKECCEDFYKETIPALEQQIPDGGSDEDVRILFSLG